jgi:transposase-like protein
VSGAEEIDDVVHSEGFKARMVQRMSGLEKISATALSREVGVAQPTLSRWLREASTLDRMAKRSKATKSGKGAPSKSPRQWSMAEKLRAVVEAAELSDEDLGAFLRRRGLHEAQLARWREAIAGALDELPKSKSRGKPSAEARELAALRKELLRKDKALAEVAALLTLQKKVQALWGDEDDATPTRSGT